MTSIFTEYNVNIGLLRWFKKRTRDRFNKQFQSANVGRKQGLPKIKEDKKWFSIVDILRLHQIACYIALIEYKTSQKEISDVMLMLEDLASQRGQNVFYDMIYEWCQNEASTSSESATTAFSSQAPALADVADASASTEIIPEYFQAPELPFESRFFADTDQSIGQPVMLGSRMQAVRDPIQKHLTDGPTDKILIISIARISSGASLMK